MGSLLGLSRFTKQRLRRQRRLRRGNRLPNLRARRLRQRHRFLLDSEHARGQTSTDRRFDRRAAAVPKPEERDDFGCDEPQRRNSLLFSLAVNVQVILNASEDDSVMKKPRKYTWNAEDYAKHSSTQHEWAKELIPKLRLSGNESLLDIGCGDGKISAMLATSLPDGCVVGIDNSEEMINLARRSFPQRDYPNLKFQVMDARALTFQNQFDRVFSNAALHWVINHRPVLEGVQRSLKSGGRLLFQMGGKGNAQDVLAILDELLIENRWRKFFENFTFPYGFYTPEEYEAWLRDVGLKPERVELIQKDMRLPRQRRISWMD